MPVASQVRGIEGDHHHMPCSLWDVAVAAGAQVGLRGLIRLNGSDLDLDMVECGVIDHPSSAQTSAAMQMANAAATSR